MKISYPKKKAYLDNLYYDLGRQTDLYLQIHNKGGVPSKWKHYLDVCDNVGWLLTANHRTPLTSEIILDFDGEEADKRYNEALEYLKKGDKNFQGWRAYDASYHIHLYVPRLRYLRIVERVKFRREVLRFFDADPQKEIDRCMIQLEHCPHWKRPNTIKALKFEGGSHE